MIGIVLVSHSHAIAEGAAELARQMGGKDVAIETAGGLEGADHPIGTDAMLVVAAIERAWSDDGVLVLMDLGSAVLSAEMALDLLSEDRRDKVRLTDAPFVEGAVAAAVTARIGAPIEQVVAEARTGLSAKTAHLGADTTETAPDLSPTHVGEDAITAEFDVAAVHGLHARPAAQLVRTAASFDADVRVRNLTDGTGPVSARTPHRGLGHRSPGEGVGRGPPGARGAQLRRGTRGVGRLDRADRSGGRGPRRVARFPGRGDRPGTTVPRSAARAPRRARPRSRCRTRRARRGARGGAPRHRRAARRDRGADR
jgi:dihydroxyacetone kinase phosphotransfer subunit